MKAAVWRFVRKDRKDRPPLLQGSVRESGQVGREGRGPAIGNRGHREVGKGTNFCRELEQKKGKMPASGSDRGPDARRRSAGGTRGSRFASGGLDRLGCAADGPFAGRRAGVGVCVVKERVLFAREVRIRAKIGLDPRCGIAYDGAAMRLEA